MARPARHACAADGWQFGSGHKDNSVCPSLACLDVKMYNFLNSEACICTVEDLKAIRTYAADAQGHLKVALIGEPQCDFIEAVCGFQTAHGGTPCLAPSPG